MTEKCSGGVHLHLTQAVLDFRFGDWNLFGFWILIFVIPPVPRLCN